MFDWLVAAINTAIGEDKECAASVGVLDIYGFESFEYNDLEQVRSSSPAAGVVGAAFQCSRSCVAVGQCRRQADTAWPSCMVFEGSAAMLWLTGCLVGCLAAAVLHQPGQREAAAALQPPCVQAGAGEALCTAFVWRCSSCTSPLVE
jgi:hypothetical protein